MVGGHFTIAKGPDTRIEPGVILVVVGARANLAQVERLAAPIRRSGPIVVAGYGTVGGKVVEMLRDAHETPPSSTNNSRQGLTWSATCSNTRRWTGRTCARRARWCWP